MIETPYRKLRTLLEESEREVNTEWLEDELYAIGFTNQSQKFLDLLDSGKKYANPNKSTIAYALGITDEEPDSAPEGLVIHEGRLSAPDIDFDIDDRRRAELIEACRDDYGEERVAHIATFTTIKPKSAVRDISRVLGYTVSDGDDLSKALPSAVFGVEKTFEEALQTETFIKEMNSSPVKREIVETAIPFEGVVRQSGIHAAGVVITDGPVIDYAPVMQTRTKSGKVSPVTLQMDMIRAEQAGLLKADFLGLRNLGVLDMCVDNIKEARGIDEEPDDIPIDDEATYKMLQEGYSQGVFQLDSGGMQKLMVALQPDCLEDIMALVALYRPGPLGAGMDRDFVARKHGRKNNSQLPQVIEDMFPDTYGTVVYQEQILRIAREIAGMSAQRADYLRKAMGKKIRKVLTDLKGEFIEGCAEVGKITEREAGSLFDKILGFADYCFNKAHSISYGMIAYQTAYYKVNYPAEYMAALLSSIDSTEAATPYLNECTRMGLEVLPPDINRSRYLYSVVGEGVIQAGFKAVRGIKEPTANHILENERGFVSLQDFFRRSNPAVLNKALVEHLTYSGALDEILPEQPDRLMLYEDKQEYLGREAHELGFFLTENPLNSVWSSFSNRVTLLEEVKEDPYFKGDIGGVITQVTKRKTRKGDRMFIYNLADIGNEVEVVVFPNQVESVGELSIGDIVIIEGKAKLDRNEEVSIIGYSSHKPSLPDYVSGKPIKLTLIAKPSREQAKKAHEVIVDNPGDRPVYLTFKDSLDQFVTIRFKRPTTSDGAEKIEEIFN